METTYIYVISQESRGDVYVGITNSPRNRWATHKSKARRGKGGTTNKLYNAMRKYGEATFQFRVIGVCDHRTAAQLAEIALIKIAQPRCNTTKGGEGTIGLEATDEQREVMRQRMTGNTLMVGRKLSDETRARMSAVGKGRPKSPEHRAKIGAAHVGMKRSPEARLKMSLAQRATAIANRVLKMTTNQEVAA